MRNFDTASSPHLQPQTSVSLVMRRVLYALIPGTIIMLGLFGIGVLTNLLLAIGSAWLTEALLLLIRRRPKSAFLSDFSVVVTGALLGLALPPLAPWWLVVSGSSFAVLFGKQLYGGLGYNPFNPAMVGYVMLLISFPAEMSQWLSPAHLGEVSLSLLDSIRYVFTGNLPANVVADGLSSATALDFSRTELGRGHALSELHSQAPFGWLGSAGWEWVSVAWLAGGAFLLYHRTIRWQTPVATLAGLAGCALVFWIYDADRFGSPLFHLFSGASIFAAIFIVTDPVTSATTPKGRIWFGVGVGVLAYIIRTWGGYPDGIAFAVLLMNMAAPTIDNYTQPRVFGHKRGEQ